MSMKKFIKSIVSVLLVSPFAVNATIKNVDPEQESWNAAQQENTASGYTKYLLDYPQGKYSELAHQALDQGETVSISQSSELQEASDRSLKADPDNLMIVV